MSNKILSSFTIIVFAFSITFSFKGFKSKKEAEEELERMYPQEEESDVVEERMDEFNSISRFVDYIFKHPDEEVFVVYGSKEQYDAAVSLRSFLGRRRGYSLSVAGTNKSGIFIIKDSDVDMQNLTSHKSFIMGKPSDNRFIRRMEFKKKISISKNKAQFRLFENPNCLAIACKTNKMFIELVRVFMRSFDDFDENCYSYFYMN